MRETRFLIENVQFHFDVPFEWPHCQPPASWQLFVPFLTGFADALFVENTNSKRTQSNLHCRTFKQKWDEIRLKHLLHLYWADAFAQCLVHLRNTIEAVGSTSRMSIGKSAVNQSYLNCFWIFVFHLAACYRRCERENTLVTWSPIAKFHGINCSGCRERKWTLVRRKVPAAAVIKLNRLKRYLRFAVITFNLLISCCFLIAKDDSASTSTEKTEDPSKKRIFNHFNFTVYVEASEKRVQQENHLNRLQKLRKELNHIKETDWQYEPIEKYIGQL